MGNIRMVKIIVAPKIEVSPKIRVTFYVINIVKVLERLIEVIKR